MSQNLKRLRDRVKSIKSIQKITKVMNMVASAKSNKAKKYDIYSANSVISEIFSNINLDEDHPLYRKLYNRGNGSKKSLVIAFGTDKGFCGSINNQLLRKIYKDVSNADVIGIGKKMYSYISKKQGLDLINQYSCSSSIDNIPASAEAISEYIYKRVMDFDYTSVSVAFLYPKNLLVSEPTIKEILPISQEEDYNGDKFVIEGKDIIYLLLKKYITIQINMAMSLSYISEQNSTMVAMDAATKNSTELIDKVTLQLNRARQQIITTELIEIISGMEALN